MKKISDQPNKNRNTEPSSPERRTFVKGIAAMGAGVAAFPLLTNTAEAQVRAAPDNRIPSGSSRPELAPQAPLAFQGDKIDWHGFDRYDFVMDKQTLAITPFKAPADEQSGNLGNSDNGQLRCVVVVPKQAAPGNPWSWRGVYWNHQPQAEVELLKRGFHIAYISVDPKPGPITGLTMNELMDQLGMSRAALREWDAWYFYLTGQYGLSKKPAFIGMSRGGIFEFSWGTANPDKVSCIYADNPGMERQAFQRLGDLARADVPVLEICGTIDPNLGQYTSAIEAIYQQLGGRISMMFKEGYAHHPHSLRNPKPIADFIERSVQEVRGPAPAFTGAKFKRTSYYSIENSYRDYPDEDTYLTCRGPLFFEDRHPRPALGEVVADRSADDPGPGDGNRVLWWCATPSGGYARQQRARDRHDHRGEAARHGTTAATGAGAQPGPSADQAAQPRARELRCHLPVGGPRHLAVLRIHGGLAYLPGLLRRRDLDLPAYRSVPDLTVR